MNIVHESYLLGVYVCVRVCVLLKEANLYMKTMEINLNTKPPL